MTDDLQQKIMSLCKRRGFVYPSSEIYGGWESSYDFGPLGALILRNIRNIWWTEFVTKQEDIVGLDGAIISHPRVPSVLHIPRIKVTGTALRDQVEYYNHPEERFWAEPATRD